MFLAVCLIPTAVYAQNNPPPQTQALAPDTSPAAASDDFVITVKTDNLGTSSNTQFTIPTTGAGYNYNMNDKQKPASHQPGNPSDLKPYTPPQIIYESELEVRAGSPLGIPRKPLDLFGLGEAPRRR